VNVLGLLEVEMVCEYECECARAVGGRDGV